MPGTITPTDVQRSFSCRTIACTASFSSSTERATTRSGADPASRTERDGRTSGAASGRSRLAKSMIGAGTR